MKRYLPERYHDERSLFEAFDDFFKPVFFDEHRDMRTDIRETDEGYRLDIEMPGFRKDQIKVSLEEGYLTVSGNRRAAEEDKNGKGEKYLRKEISETFQRSYYVGTEVEEESVKAKYDNGILSLTVPKSKPRQIQSHSINIE